MSKSSDTKTIADLLDRAIEAGKVEKSGNWLSFAGEKLGNGKTAAVAFVVENAAIAEKIEAALGPSVPPEHVLGGPLKVAEFAPSTEPVAVRKPATSTGAVADSVTLAFPLPAGASADDLKTASIVVTSKPAEGRGRAGFRFTREETLIAYPDLSDEQIAALTGDPYLVVTLRLTKPD